MPETGGRPVVDVVREYEEHNYQQTIRLLGDTAHVPEMLSSLYDYVIKAYEQSKLPPTDQYATPLTLLLACQYQLIIASLTMERGHVTDGYQATRRAVESCAFARKIALHPHLAVVWLEAWESKEKYATYQDKFKKLFPTVDPLMSRLGERYDEASKQMHSTVHSLANRLRQTEDDRAIYLNFDYFEGDAQRVDKLLLGLLWVWDTHLLMIKAFASFLPDVFRPVEKGWNLQ